MPYFPIGVCILSHSSFLSLYLAYVACDDIKCADHVRIRLVQPLVALLTFATYLGRSMLMVLMALLGSVLWDIT